MNYKLKSSYYSCYCGGTFYVDLKAKIYGIAPCKYNYICSRCQKRKAMYCREEVESLAKFEQVLTVSDGQN